MVVVVVGVVVVVVVREVGEVRVVGVVIVVVQGVVIIVVVVVFAVVLSGVILYSSSSSAIGVSVNAIYPALTSHQFYCPLHLTTNVSPLMFHLGIFFTSLWLLPPTPFDSCRRPIH